MNHSYSISQFYCDIYYSVMSFKLGEVSWHKFKLKADILSKSVMEYLFWILSIESSAILVIPTIIAHFDAEQSFDLLMVVIWTPITIIWLALFYSTSMIGFISWYLVALYLKSKFKEINQDIEQSLNQSNGQILVKAMFEHNLVTKKLDELNEFFKYMVFIFYYGTTLCLVCLVYISHAEDTILAMRLVSVFVVISIFGGVFSMNLISVFVRNAAHKPYPLLIIRDRVNNKLLLYPLFFGVFMYCLLYRVK